MTVSGLLRGFFRRNRPAKVVDPSAIDRVRQVYTLRPDVRRVFPLGLTPGQSADYGAWLHRYGWQEYGLQENAIEGYLAELASDPSCCLGETYLLTPDWQRAVPDGLSPDRWPELKRFISATNPGLSGRWLKRARRPERFEIRNDPNRTINLLGHFKYESGLQEEALRHAAALERAGYSVGLRDIPIAFPRDPSGPERFLALERGPITLVKAGASEPLDELYERAGLHPRPGVHRIACWSWELEEWPRRTAENSNLVDEVWTPSTFCSEAARRSMSGKPVFTMTPAVSLPRFDPKPRSAFGLPDHRFLVLFAFDMASGMQRKNPLGLIEAFRLAFRPHERVHLAIKVTRGGRHPAEFAALHRAAAAAGVTILDAELPRSDVAALLACCDAYASLHRSEGFGFTMAEAMLLGKPTLATGYSGNLDFMTPDNSYLVKWSPTRIENDIPPYPKGSVWAEPDLADAARQIRRIFDNREEAAAIAAQGKADAERILSEDASAARMLNRLREIRTK